MKERLRAYILETGGISHENCDNYRCLFRHGARGSQTAGGSLFGTSGSLADCPPDGPDAGAGTDAADPGAVFRHRSDGCIPAGDAGKRASARKPNVKILVNASGFGKIGTVGNLPLDDETGMVELNCKALCAVTHMVLPYMSENSRILQFASAASFLPQPGFAIYAATKAFVLSYSRALREELRPRRIGVTAVCPGPVKTEFFDIAETTWEIPLYNRLVMADPHKVVKLAIRDCMAGKSVSVYGVWMKAFFVICKVVPHEWILRAMQALNH